MVKDSRVIRIMSDIDEEMTVRFFEEIAALEAADNLKPITIELSSGGGVAYEALAIAARMRTSPCDIKVIGYGLVASAATLILAYGDQRCMTAEAWLMVHEDSGEQTGSITVLERKVKHDRAMEVQWAKLFAERSKANFAKWTELNKAETHLTAQGCLALGLIDKVI